AHVPAVVEDVDVLVEGSTLAAFLDDGAEARARADEGFARLALPFDRAVAAVLEVDAHEALVFWLVAAFAAGNVGVPADIARGEDRAAGDVVEREPGVAVDDAILGDRPVDGESLGLDRIVADVDEVVVDDLDI